MDSLLSSLKPGATGTIAGFIDGKEALVRRVIEMGIVPGAEFTLRHRAVMGDPLAIEIRGGILALGFEEAKIIKVLCD